MSLMAPECSSMQSASETCWTALCRLWAQMQISEISAQGELWISLYEAFDSAILCVPRPQAFHKISLLAAWILILGKGKFRLVARKKRQKDLEHRSFRSFRFKSWICSTAAETQARRSFKSFSSTRMWEAMAQISNDHSTAFTCDEKLHDASWNVWNRCQHDWCAQEWPAWARVSAQEP